MSCLTTLAPPQYYFLSDGKFSLFAGAADTGPEGPAQPETKR